MARNRSEKEQSDEGRMRDSNKQNIDETFDPSHSSSAANKQAINTKKNISNLSARDKKKRTRYK